MSAEIDDARDTFVDQLSSFDDKLEDKADDVEMLSDIQQGIGRLVNASGGSEFEIRRLLQERFDHGGLRKETFQLVSSMLDRYITENIPTSPFADEPEESLADDSADDRDSQQQTSEPEKVSVSNGAAVDQDTGYAATAVLPGGPASLSESPEANVSSSNVAGNTSGNASTEDRYGATAVLPRDTATRGSAEDRVQIGSILRDRFMLQERVAGGSMGVVYKALDRRLAEADSKDPWVAIKVLTPKLSQNGKALRALQQEAAKGRCLVHPNIVRFIDLDRDDDLYFIIMEWMEGRTLADILDSPESKTVDLPCALDIVKKTGKALDYAHRCGIVHADVKPGNVMILEDGEPKLFDFGVARVRQTQTESGAAFDPGVLGAMTPAYSSMQVLTGEQPVPADDVFSLACLYYRLVAGYRVFGPRNAAEAAEEGMSPQRPNGLGDTQWRAMKKALSFSRVTRFESMAEFVDALEESTAVENDQVEEKKDKRAKADKKNEVETKDVETNKASQPNKVSNLEVLDDAAKDVPPTGGGFKWGWVLGLPAALVLLSFTAFQFGLIDGILGSSVEVPRDKTDGEPVTGVDAAADAVVDGVPGLDREPATADVIETPIDEGETVDVEPVEYASIDTAAEPVEKGDLDTINPAVEFSTLPSADVSIEIAPESFYAPVVQLELREDGTSRTVELYRQGRLDLPLSLRVEELDFSGNRSPWATGQYEIEEGSAVEFAAGQESIRLTLSMTQDSLREADQQSTLHIREVDSSADELATIEVTLVDDDQRAFEADLPMDTIGFSASQVSVDEGDPAVQVDVVRFNPGDSALTVIYDIRGVTATSGADYFEPGADTVTFGPSQRSARLLIPLVQDSLTEGDEAFVIELSRTNSAADVNYRVAVMIRDDDLTSK